MTRAETLYGTDEAEPAPLGYAAGPLTFELLDGNVRAIRFGGVELLRGIQYLVRDRDWGTLPPTISALRVDEGDGVRIAYHATCTDHDGARLEYDATILATPAGLDFTVENVTRDDFTACRVGFSVLHPAGLAGSPLRVEHGDGSVEDAAFPVAIEPWQPFTDIRALIHRQGGLRVECRLDGDTFEMEDQRNWSDASYKTYGRPLARPWPYVIPAGTRDRQSVRLTVTGAPAARPDAGAGGDVEIVIGEAVGMMPRIGLVVTPEEASATGRQRAWLVRSGVQDLLLTFDAAAGHGAANMAALARAVGTSPMRRTLECVLACAGDLDAELQAIAGHVERAGLALDAIAVFPAPDLQSTPPGSEWPACPPLDAVYAAARRAFPGFSLGGGMFGYFTEFNRKRPPAGRLDFVAHATCPIVHAADDRSVMQTLETVPHIMRSARAIVPDTPYRLGPVTIGMRQNPYGSRTIPNPGNRRLPMARNDPRQAGRFAAAWTLGYAAGTEEGRLDTLTPGALTGPFGIVGQNGPRPVFDAVAALADLAGTRRRACRPSAPDKLAAVCAGGTLLLANLTPRPVRARVPDGRVETLDAYAIARIALA